MNVFEPVVANLVSLNSSASNLVSTEVDNANTDAADAENEVATEELKLPVTLATDADNDV
jgi:hypothetical protein